jgi:hypothetical protein
LILRAEPVADLGLSGLTYWAQGSPCNSGNRTQSRYLVAAVCQGDLWGGGMASRRAVGDKLRLKIGQ